MYCIHRTTLPSKYYLIFQMRKSWLPEVKYYITVAYVFNGGVEIFTTSKIILFSTTPVCLSFQLVWNSTGLHSKICSSTKFQGNLIITFCFDRCSALRWGGIVNFTSVGCCCLKWCSAFRGLPKFTVRGNFYSIINKLTSLTALLPTW